MYNQREFSELPPLEQAARSIPIIKAIYQGDLTKLKQLISMGEDVNIHIEGGGKTPLHVACEYGNFEFIKELILAGADINAKTQMGFSPLQVAAQEGATNIVELLCETNGIDINVASNSGGCTPLHEAAAKGHMQTTLTLLKFNADPNLKDKIYNLTAANLAHNAGHSKIRDLITEYMNYHQSFIQNVNNNLFVAQRLCVANTPAHQFLSKLSNSLKGIEDGEKVFKIISENLKSKEFEPLKFKLQEVRALLIKNMKLYNENRANEKKQKQSVGVPTQTI